LKHGNISLKLFLILGLMIFSSLILSGAAAATAVNNSTIYVSTQGNDSWDGLQQPTIIQLDTGQKPL